MRTKTIDITGAATLDLGTVKDIFAGQRVLIAASSSAAGTLRATFGGNLVAEGTINLEETADAVHPKDDVICSFVAGGAGELIIETAGTITDGLVRIFVLDPSESVPW